MTLAVCLAIAGLVLAFIWWQLDRSNMIVPEGAERILPQREALRFALDNGLPIRSGVEYVPGSV